MEKRNKPFYVAIAAMCCLVFVLQGCVSQEKKCGCGTDLMKVYKKRRR